MPNLDLHDYLLEHTGSGMFAPGTAHPSFASGEAALARTLIDRGEQTIWITPVKRFRVNGPEPATDLLLMDERLIRLTVRRRWSLAPYVGEPFYYTWRIAQDQYGRWIASNTVARVSRLQP